MEVAGRTVLDGWFCWFLIFLSKNARLFVIFVDTCITNGYNLLFVRLLLSYGKIFRVSSLTRR